MASDLAQEALRPFAAVGSWLSLEWRDNDDTWPAALAEHDFAAAPSCPTVGDLRRARTAYDAIGSGVKALEWEHHRDAPGNARASSEFGTYRLRANGEEVMWGCRADGVSLGSKAASMREAKAAAQADFERRVLSCLSDTAAGAVPVEEADAKARDDAQDEQAAVVFYRDNPRAALFDLNRRLRTIPSEPEAKGEAGAGPVRDATDGEAFWKLSFQTESRARIEAEARLGRLLLICRQIKWVGIGMPAAADSSTQQAFVQLAELLFADGIETAIQKQSEFPPSTCNAWEDCKHDGVCHDPEQCGFQEERS